MKYNHSIAVYPEDFKGSVVSPTKICLQFANPECKLRVNPELRQSLIKTYDGDKAILVQEHGTDVNIVAVGCQMPVVEKYQFELIESYKKYYHIHKEVYKEKYNKDFKDFVLQLQSSINNLVAIVTKGE